MNRLAYILLLLLAAPGLSGAQNPIVWTGGITLEERQTAPEQGTRLSFFITSGSFLSNITVSVRNAAGNEVVNTVTTGPWLILALDPGRYQVVAQRENGQVQSLVIDVTNANQEFGFAFPE